MPSSGRRATGLAALVATGLWAGPLGYYPTYRETDSILTSLQQKYPHLVKRMALTPKTLENRDILAVKVSSSPDADNHKPEALISGVQHAAEPIGAAVIRDDLVYLCENYGKDPEVTWLLDNRQIWFVPVMNPDGYEFIANGGDKMWRKNRRPNAGGSFGVDLNRNYPFKWGYDNVNSSPTPTAINYRGPSPASEPETKAMMAFVNQHRFRTWQNHHSPNDVLVIPFGYDYKARLPQRDSLVYEALCQGQQAHYGRFKKWGPSFIAYDGWALNGGTEDWGWSDSATYRVYTIISEIGKDYWETDAAAREVSQKMRGAELHMIQSAGFYPLVQGLAVTDTCQACNRNGIANPGETVRIKVAIRNQSVVDTTVQVKGFLGSASTYLTWPDSAGEYGSMPPLAVAGNDADAFTVALALGTPPGQKIPLRMRMTWELNAVTYEKILPCTLTVGPVGAGIATPGSTSDRAVSAARQSTGWVRFSRPRTSGLPGNPVPMQLKIYAPNRLIRVFPPASASASEVLWDKTDGNGMRVGPGVYIAVWVFPTGRISTRLALTD